MVEASLLLPLERVDDLLGERMESCGVWGGGVCDGGSNLSNDSLPLRLTDAGVWSRFLKTESETVADDGKE